MSTVNYRAWDIAPLTHPNPSKQDMYWNIAGWAILAPSSHNVQPWRFILRPKEDIIDVCLTRAGVLAASDKKGRQATISMGCALRNIVLACRYYDFVPDLHFSQGFYPEALVRVYLGKKGEKKTREPIVARTLDAVRTRRMNRGEYDPLRPVPESVLAEMRAISKRHGLTLKLATHNRERIDIAELQYHTELRAIADTDFRNELADFLLPNDSTEGRGMPGTTFGISDTMAIELREALAREGMFNPDFSAGLARASRDGMRKSPVIGIISADQDTPECWLQAGMALQEIALLAEMNSLSLAVHASIVEYADVKIFNDEYRKILPKQTKRPLVIFRMGYATQARPHSPRLGLEEMVEWI